MKKEDDILVGLVRKVNTKEEILIGTLITHNWLFVQPELKDLLAVIPQEEIPFALIMAGCVVRPLWRRTEGNPESDFESFADGMEFHAERSPGKVAEALMRGMPTLEKRATERKMQDVVAKGLF